MDDDERNLNVLQGIRISRLGHQSHHCLHYRHHHHHHHRSYQTHQNRHHHHRHHCHHNAKAKQHQKIQIATRRLTAMNTRHFSNQCLSTFISNCILLAPSSSSPSLHCGLMTSGTIRCDSIGHVEYRPSNHVSCNDCSKEPHVECHHDKHQ